LKSEFVLPAKSHFRRRACSELAKNQIPARGPQVAKLIPIGPMSHAPRLVYIHEELTQIKILSALDTYAPIYDQPQSMETV
jgi:hypothetical protein